MTKKEVQLYDTEKKRENKDLLRETTKGRLATVGAALITQNQDVNSWPSRRRDFYRPERLGNLEMNVAVVLAFPRSFRSD